MMTRCDVMGKSATNCDGSGPRDASGMALLGNGRGTADRGNSGGAGSRAGTTVTSSPASLVFCRSWRVLQGETSSSPRGGASRTGFRDVGEWECGRLSLECDASVRLQLASEKKEVVIPVGVSMLLKLIMLN